MHNTCGRCYNTFILVCLGVTFWVGIQFRPDPFYCTLKMLTGLLVLEAFGHLLKNAKAGWRAARPALTTWRFMTQGTDGLDDFCLLQETFGAWKDAVPKERFSGFKRWEIKGNLWQNKLTQKNLNKSLLERRWIELLRKETGWYRMCMLIICASDVYL